MNYTGFCKQGNQVVFLVLGPIESPPGLLITPLLWAEFAVRGQRTVRAGAGAFEHRGWDW